MEINLPIQEAGNAVEKIGQTERTLFVGIMISILIFVGYLVWAFLQALETKDQRFTESLDKVTDALKENTEAMIELKSAIK